MVTKTLLKKLSTLDERGVQTQRGIDKGKLLLGTNVIILCDAGHAVPGWKYGSVFFAGEILISYPKTQCFLQKCVESKYITPRPKLVPLKKFSSQFGMPFANKTWMKGLKLEAMDSKHGSSGSGHGPRINNMAQITPNFFNFHRWSFGMKQQIVRG